VLAEAVDPLAVVGGEALLEPPVPVARRHEQPRAGPPEVRALLGQQFFTRVGADEPQLRVGPGVGVGDLDERGERAVDHPAGPPAGDVVEDAVPPGPHPQAVGAPRLDEQDLVPYGDFERAAVFGRGDHAVSSGR
jgi:hypothetical protein